MVLAVAFIAAVSALLKTFVGERKSGFLFKSRKGKPIGPSNVVRRHLHPALEKLGYVNPHTGTHKAGNHAFRRLRNTHLMEKTTSTVARRIYLSPDKLRTLCQLSRDLDYTISCFDVITPFREDG